MTRLTPEPAKTAGIPLTLPSRIARALLGAVVALALAPGLATADTDRPSCASQHFVSGWSALPGGASSETPPPTRPCE